MVAWTKNNNSIESYSDTTGTNGRIPGSNTAGKFDQGTQYIERGITVIKDGSTYKCWYVGATFNIGYATSDDGLTWTKYNITIEAASDTTGTNGRIPKGSTAGRNDVAGAGLTGLTVIKDTDGSYLMWYVGWTGKTITHAYSDDGLTWTKLDNSVPAASDTSSTNSRIALGTNTKGDDTRIYSGGNSIITDGSILRYYYCGHDGATVRIYMATADIPDESSSSSSSSMSVSSSSSSSSKSVSSSSSSSKSVSSVSSSSSSLGYSESSSSKSNSSSSTSLAYSESSSSSSSKSVSSSSTSLGYSESSESSSSSSKSVSSSSSSLDYSESSSSSSKSVSSSSSLEYSSSSSSYDFNLIGYTLLYINRTDKYWTPISARSG